MLGVLVNTNKLPKGDTIQKDPVPEKSAMKTDGNGHSLAPAATSTPADGVVPAPAPRPALSPDTQQAMIANLMANPKLLAMLSDPKVQMALAQSQAQQK